MRACKLVHSSPLCSGPLAAFASTLSQFLGASSHWQPLLPGLPSALAEHFGTARSSLAPQTCGSGCCHHCQAPTSSWLQSAPEQECCLKQHGYEMQVRLNRCDARYLHEVAIVGDK